MHIIFGDLVKPEVQNAVCVVPFPPVHTRFMTAYYCQAALVQHWARDPDRKKTDFNDWQGETQPYGHCFTSCLKKALFEAFVHIQLYQAKLGSGL